MSKYLSFTEFLLKKIDLDAVEPESLVSIRQKEDVARAHKEIRSEKIRIPTRVESVDIVRCRHTGSIADFYKFFVDRPLSSSFSLYRLRINSDVYEGDLLLSGELILATQNRLFREPLRLKLCVFGIASRGEFPALIDFHKPRSAVLEGRLIDAEQNDEMFNLSRQVRREGENVTFPANSVNFSIQPKLIMRIENIVWT